MGFPEEVQDASIVVNPGGPLSWQRSRINISHLAGASSNLLTLAPKSLLAANECRCHARRPSSPCTRPKPSANRQRRIDLCLTTLWCLAHPNRAIRCPKCDCPSAGLPGTLLGCTNGRSYMDVFGLR